MHRQQYVHALIHSLASSSFTLAPVAGLSRIAFTTAGLMLRKCAIRRIQRPKNKECESLSRSLTTPSQNSTVSSVLSRFIPHSVLSLHVRAEANNHIGRLQKKRWRRSGQLQQPRKHGCVAVIA